jgi:hypothetical protein
LKTLNTQLYNLNTYTKPDFLIPKVITINSTPSTPTSYALPLKNQVSALNAKHKTLSFNQQLFNPKPQTLNPNPQTLNPQPSNLIPNNLKPELETLNPKILNPKPQHLAPNHIPNLNYTITRTLNPKH